MKDDFLKVARQAALEAGKIISKYYGEELVRNLKNEDPSNFATQADVEAENAIVKILTSNFPDHNIIAEEGSRVKNNSKYTWVIDPLDGTFSFSHGLPFFSVSIGLLFNKQPIVGVIYHVSAKDLYYGQKGKGAFLNGEVIKVSKHKVLEESACGLDFRHKQTRNENLKSYINPLINKVGYPYCVGSSVTTQALVAKGMLDAYINEAWIWDFVAGAVIIREAGGKVTDFKGNEPDWSKQRLSIVASNGLIHDQILEALKK